MQETLLRGRVMHYFLIRDTNKCTGCGNCDILSANWGIPAQFKPKPMRERQNIQISAANAIKHRDVLELAVSRCMTEALSLEEVE